MMCDVVHRQVWKRKKKRDWKNVKFSKIVKVNLGAVSTYSPTEFPFSFLIFILHLFIFLLGSTGLLVLGFFKISIGLDLIEDWNLLSQLRGEPLNNNNCKKRTRLGFYLSFVVLIISLSWVMNFSKKREYRKWLRDCLGRIPNSPFNKKKGCEKREVVIFAGVNDCLYWFWVPFTFDPHGVLQDYAQRPSLSQDNSLLSFPNDYRDWGTEWKRERK